MDEKSKKNIKTDFREIEGLMIAPRDPDIPKQVLHGTPAIVTRHLDDVKYSVLGLYYDGDAKGFVVTILSDGKATEILPGQYRTHALFMYDERSNDLNVMILD